MPVGVDDDDDDDEVGGGAEGGEVTKKVRLDEGAKPMAVLADSTQRAQAYPPSIWVGQDLRFGGQGECGWLALAFGNARAE
eukprot:15485425-Alexandrium_andersonii.AAC.1